MTKAYYSTAGSDQLVIKDISLAELKSNEIKVKVHAVSLNYRDLLNLKYNQANDFVAMSDGAGEVIQVGSEVSEFKVGDRVAGLFFPDWQDGDITEAIQATARGGNGKDGMLATEVVGNSDSFISIPDHLSYQEGATLPCAGLTAWNALFEYGSLKMGQTVVIQGSGGVALFALQLAKQAGAHAIVLSSKTQQFDFLHSLGADHVINYRETPEWQENVKALTGGRGADIILELGGAGTLERSMEAVKIHGEISMVGVLTGLDGAVVPNNIIMKSLKINGIYVGSKAMQQRFHAALSQNNIKPVIDKETFAFEEANEAFAYQSSAKHIGNIVISV